MVLSDRFTKTVNPTRIIFGHASVNTRLAEVTAKGRVGCNLNCFSGRLVVEPSDRDVRPFLGQCHRDSGANPCCAPVTSATLPANLS